MPTIANPYMKLDPQGGIMIEGKPVEEYLQQLESAREILEGLALRATSKGGNLSIDATVDALVKFYSTYKKCTEPIRVLVKEPHGYSGGEYHDHPEEYIQPGNILFMFSYVPDYPGEGRVQEGDSEYREKTPKELDISAKILYNPPEPKPKKVVLVTKGMSGLIDTGKTLKQCGPKLLADYTKRLHDDVKRILTELRFPVGTKFDISYGLPILENEGTFEIR